MICAVIADIPFAKALEVIKTVPFAELRLDLCRFSKKQIKKLLSSDCNFIATCRPGIYSEKERADLLSYAIKCGASYVDIEVESGKIYRNALIKKAKKEDVQIIISYHDFKKTPANTALNRIVSQCFRKGADIAKIACMLNEPSDGARLLALHNGKRKLIVAGMGELSPVVRVAAPFLGSLFSYAAVSRGKESAPGQLTVKEMKAVLKAFGA